jgi:hypothetical protein
MAEGKRRSELHAEVMELHKQQLEAASSAIFVGWTAIKTAAYDARTQRIALLNAQIAALDEIYVKRE